MGCEVLDRRVSWLGLIVVLMELGFRWVSGLSWRSGMRKLRARNWTDLPETVLLPFKATSNKARATNDPLIHPPPSAALLC